MSPEANIPKPEQQDEKPYVRKAHELAEAVAAQPEQETEARFQAIDKYVADILNAADVGEIPRSKGGSYSKEDMLDQLDTFLDLIGKSEDERKGVDPFGYIPNANGLRDSMRFLMANEETAIDLKLSLNLNVRGNETAQVERLSEPSPEMITSEIVREKMGGISLDAMGIDEPLPEVKVSESEAPKLSKEEYLSTLADGFSEEEIAALEEYATSKAALNRATANGEYDNAAHWKREVYSDLKRLPKAAQEIADQYAHARNYY